MISSVLVANRGEIAVRIVRALKELGIRSVVAYSEADRDSLAVKLADDSVCVGPPPSRLSYLNSQNLVTAAVLKHCDAVHPGVGFLSENASFAQDVVDAGLIFIGPRPETIALVGDKVQAKRTALQNGVPVIPGSEGSIEDADAAQKSADEMGYPVIVKAAAGGGGKGMRIVRRSEEFKDTLRIASSEAESAFGDGTVYLEKYLENPRHVELQILADSFGNVIHLGERDCSVQKNHQKLVEESPSPAVDDSMRREMGESAIRMFEAIGYQGAGTIEFLVAGGQFYFMEVNARVQVEHPVTELVTGVDIIQEMVRVASGQKLRYSQKDIQLSGYAIEVRINAAAPGRVQNYLPPGGFGTRVDSFLYNGYMVPPHYDSLIAKVLVRGADRNSGLNRMNRVLEEFTLEGVPTNIELQKKIINSKVFRSGRFGTDVLARILEETT